MAYEKLIFFWLDDAQDSTRPSLIREHGRRLPHSQS
jgi:hypothetical protein